MATSEAQAQYGARCPKQAMGIAKITLLILKDLAVGVTRMQTHRILVHSQL